MWRAISQEKSSKLIIVKLNQNVKRIKIMIITNVRLDWLFVWQKSKKGKFGGCVMMPLNHPQLEEVKAEIAKAKAAGIKKNMFTEANTKSASFKQCLRNGDEEVATGERLGHYKGHMFFNCNNKEQPGIVGPDTAPLMDQAQLYSGCFCNVDVNFYPFNNESKGVGAGLNNIMLVRAGDRLDGRQDAATAFAGMTVNDDLQ
jgi:hypothetical protein